MSRLMMASLARISMGPPYARSRDAELARVEDLGHRERQLAHVSERAGGSSC
jgi:hypothetical protein